MKPNHSHIRNLLWAIVCLIAANSSLAAQQPNVIIIYGDDVGYSDVGVYGATEIATPNIDQLARDGLLFTDAHSTAATCTPSRFSMLTGVHAFRHNVGILPPNGNLAIPTEVLTLPKLFQQAGYATGVIGKWHLGFGNTDAPIDWNGELKPGPLETGFDTAFLLPTTNDRVPTVYVAGHRVLNLDPNDPLYVGDQLADVQKPGSTQYPDARQDDPTVFYKSVVNGLGRIGYMSGGKSALWDDETMADVFVDQAKAYIAANKDQPFFLYFSSQDIHFPNAPNPRFKGKTKLGKRGDAMVQLDWSVGEIVTQLDQLELADNTIVIFTSDNGPTQHDDEQSLTQAPEPSLGEGTAKHDASGIWRGGKYEIYEGGTRIPLIIRWPGKIKYGTSDALVSQIDFTASFATLFGAELGADDAIDSRDILATFIGEESKGLPYIIEEAGFLAVRAGDWKFVPARDPKRANKSDPLEDTLFNLKDDPSEQVNIIGKYPQEADELRVLLKNARKKTGIRAQQ